MLYSIFWVIPRSLNFICRRFGTSCLFHFYKQCKYEERTAYIAYEDGTECYETPAYKIQTPGNDPKERIQHSKQDESFISRELNYVQGI
jgi:hypothetical protein